MRTRSALLAVVGGCCLTQTIWAHPGHAVEAGSQHGLLHYVTHPDHLAQWLVAAACIVAAVAIARRVKRLAPAYAKVRKSDKQ